MHFVKVIAVDLMSYRSEIQNGPQGRGFSSQARLTLQGVHLTAGEGAFDC
jgi:hypothetical protein